MLDVPIGDVATLVYKLIPEMRQEKMRLGKSWGPLRYSEGLVNTLRASQQKSHIPRMATRFG